MYITLSDLSGNPVLINFDNIFQIKHGQNEFTNKGEPYTEITSTQGSTTYIKENLQQVQNRLICQGVQIVAA